MDFDQTYTDFDYKPDSELNAIAHGDIDNDGDIDVFVGTKQRILIYRNLGEFSFELYNEIDLSTQAILGSDLELIEIHTVDFDNNGNLDFIISGNGIHHFKNDGTGLYSDIEQIIANSSIHRIVLADFNNDGELDILAGNLYENVGDGEFVGLSPSLNLPNSQGDFHEAGHLDDDNFIDICVWNDEDDELYILSNNTDLSFSFNQSIEHGLTALYDILIGDFENDGKNEIIVTGHYNPQLLYKKTYEFKWNYFDGYVQEDYDPSSMNRIEMYDIDGDGINELLGDRGAMYSFQGVYAMPYLGKPSDFYNMIQTELWNIIEEPIDDKRYLLITNRYETVHFLEIEQSRVLDKHLVHSSPYFIQNQEFVDIDGDSDIDLIVHTDQNDLLWYENLGDNEFSEQQMLIPNVKAFETVDLNYDGLLDIVANTYSEFTWYFNQGAGEFEKQEKLIENHYGLVFIVADLNSDQDLDLVVSYDDRLVWYENLGDGVFSLNETEIRDWSFAGLHLDFICDLDNDGDNDIILYDPDDADDPQTIYESNNDAESFYGINVSPSFNNTLPYRVRKSEGAIYEDIDDDGIEEIVTVHGVIHLDGNFEYSAGVEFLYDQKIVAFQDINGDNVKDILAKRYNKLHFYCLNNCDNFGSEIIEYQDHISDASLVDFDSNGVQDLFVSTYNGLNVLTNACLPVEEMEEEILPTLDVNIYPTQVENILYLQFDENVDVENDIYISIFTTSGDNVYSSSGTDSIDLTGIPVGVYVIVVTDLVGAGSFSALFNKV